VSEYQCRDQGVETWQAELHLQTATGLWSPSFAVTKQMIRTELSLSLHLMTKTISLALVDLLQMLAEEPRRSHKTRTKQHVPRLCWLQTAAWSFPPAIRHCQLLRTLTEIHDRAIKQMEQHFGNDHLPWTALPWEFTGSIRNSGAGNYSEKDGRLLFFTYLNVKDVSVHRPVQNTFEGFAVQDPASLLLQEPSLRNRCRAHRSWFSYVPSSSSSSSCCSICAAMSASRVWSSHKRAWTCRTERRRERDNRNRREHPGANPGERRVFRV
jgi:hypothetical protein